MRAAVRQIGPGNDQRARVLSARMVAVNRRRCRPNSPSAVDQNPPSRLEQPHHGRHRDGHSCPPGSPMAPSLPPFRVRVRHCTDILGSRGGEQHKILRAHAGEVPRATPQTAFAWWHARRPEQSRPGATTFPCRVQRCNRAPLDVGHPLAAVCFAFIIESDSWRLVSRNRSPLALLPPVHEPPPLLLHLSSTSSTSPGQPHLARCRRLSSKLPSLFRG